MNPRRLRHGEWLAAAGGVALLGSLFAPWYGFRARTETTTGFESFAVIDLLLVVVAAAGLVLATLQARHTGPAVPVGAAVVTTVVGLLGLLLVAFRLIDQPGPNEFVEVRTGAWVGLAGALGVAAGGWLAIRDERAPHVPPGPEPELRPAP